MQKTVTLDEGECELITRWATRAIAKGELRKQEGEDAQAIREKIVESEAVLVI